MNLLSSDYNMDIETNMQLSDLNNLAYIEGSQLIIPTQQRGAMICECGTIIEPKEIVFDFGKEIQVLLRMGCARFQCPVYKGRTQLKLYKLVEIDTTDTVEPLYEKLVNFKGIGERTAKAMMATQFDTVKKAKDATIDDLMTAGLTEVQAKVVMLAVA